jgi:Spx/MgsR family transcriptional regulator
MPATLYGLDRCDTCRKARNWLERQGVAHRFVDLRAERVAAATLKAWAAALGGFDSMVNRSGTTWRALPPARRAPGSAAEWTLLLREHPALIRRPLTVLEDGRVQQGFSDALFKRLFADAPAPPAT